MKMYEENWIQIHVKYEGEREKFSIFLWRILTKLSGPGWESDIHFVSRDKT